jgi:hypothetical protein
MHRTDLVPEIELAFTDLVHPKVEGAQIGWRALATQLL